MKTIVKSGISNTNTLFYQKDLKTAIVVGNQSSKTVEIEKFISVLLGSITNTEIITISAKNPVVEELPKVNTFEQVICVGGGKVIDIGKMIALGLNQNEMKLKIQNLDLSLKRKLKLICIPTTSGSGSEATHFAVCYFEGKKYSVSDETILPDIAILDPLLLASQSPQQMRYSALDTLCQCIESMFSKGASLESISYSKAGAVLCLTQMENLSVNNVGAEYIKPLQFAAHLSGKAINISKTNLPHALSYFLTTRFDIPHGLAVSLFMEVYLRNILRNRDMLNTMQQECIVFLSMILSNGNELDPSSWPKLLDSLKLPSNINQLDFKIDKDDLKGSINIERMNNLSIKVDIDEFLLEVFEIEQILLTKRA